MKSIGIALTTMLLALTSAHAAEVLFKGRNVQQKSEVVIHHQAEDKSYGSGTYRSQGLTFLEDAKVATFVNQGAFSWDGGVSRHTGFILRKYPDGSMTTARYVGTTRKSEGQKVRDRLPRLALATPFRDTNDPLGHSTRAIEQSGSD
jgi:hypothetical protein